MGASPCCAENWLAGACCWEEGGAPSACRNFQISIPIGCSMPGFGIVAMIFPPSTGGLLNTPSVNSGSTNSPDRSWRARAHARQARRERWVCHGLPTAGRCNIGHRQVALSRAAGRACCETTTRGRWAIYPAKHSE